MRSPLPLALALLTASCGGPKDRGLFEHDDASTGSEDANGDEDATNDDAAIEPATDTGEASDGDGLDAGPLDGGPIDAGCAAPRRLCGGACVDVQTDPRHCGACGAACTTLGQACVAGKCACAATTCSGRCVNLATDPNHCGACGNDVCENEICVGGKAQCAPGFKACGGGLPGCLGCESLLTDGSNCGACGRGCPAQTCLKGACVDGAACPAPLTRCDSFIFSGGCTDLSRDPSNCGTCGNQCKTGELCAKGKCTPFAGAVGCASCPCAACRGALPLCCSYGGIAVCASGCP